MFFKYVDFFLHRIALKSIDTLNHCIRVSKLSMKIGHSFDLSQKDMKDLLIASLLHDIGKIGIPQEILNKPNSLTKNEYEIIKTHCEIGMEYLSEVNIFNDISHIILYHHERYDGQGYPYGLIGNHIPFLSRIIAVADSFDAMISPRVYKKQISIPQALNEIFKNRGTQFDTTIADQFIKIIKP
ncbi:HD-GYP domain-containing protein [Inediibacterium massiliense]|uniref:HD-GYP domain-containing protein n=1 Tax=Inediibacterium massiliense TaxID=1658111 RepID=UPI00241D21E6|nr:HD-GYP domain-containing protein [Inediibacterium massiliense]